MPTTWATISEPGSIQLARVRPALNVITIIFPRRGPLRSRDHFLEFPVCYWYSNISEGDMKYIGASRSRFRHLRANDFSNSTNACT